MAGCNKAVQELGNVHYLTVDGVAKYHFRACVPPQGNIGMRAESRKLGVKGNFMGVVGLHNHKLGYHHRGRFLRPILPFRDAKMRTTGAF